jgi:voltage-gated potassium channel
VRLVRLIRLLRLSAILARAVQRERVLSSGATFRVVALLTVAVVVVGGSIEALVDNTKDFKSTWDGIWWAVVTVTTVGYGDKIPTSVDGKIIAMVVVFVGIGFLSVLTASIASVFVKSDRGSEYQELSDALGRIERELSELRRQLATD